jgi:hypothetical protein
MLELILSLATFLALAAPSILFVRNYSLADHRSALMKAFFLWVVSTSPVIGAILLSKPTSKNGDLAGQFQLEVLANFTITEMFVYSASFLAPVLYVVFDILSDFKEGDVKFEKKAISNYLRGMQSVFISSIFILILTLLAYASAKSDPVGFSQTYLALFLTGKGYIIYLASLLIWYSVILWEKTPKVKFENSQSEKATEFSDEYQKRRTGNQ